MAFGVRIQGSYVLFLNWRASHRISTKKSQLSLHIPKVIRAIIVWRVDEGFRYPVLRFASAATLFFLGGF